MTTAERDVERLVRWARHLEYTAPEAAGTDPDLTTEWMDLRPRLSRQALAQATVAERREIAHRVRRLIASLALRRSRRQEARAAVELELLEP